MALIKQYQWEEIKRKSGNQIRDLPCMELLDEEGNYLATLIIPCMSGGPSIFDHTRTQAEYLGLQGNIVYVEPPEESKKTPFQEAIEIVDSLTCSECGFIAKARIGLISHKRRHVKELVRV